MLDNNTSTKLHEMKLHAMSQAFLEQLKDPTINTLSFEERFGLIVDSEWATRKSNRLKSLIKGGCYFFTDACLEDVEYQQTASLIGHRLPDLAPANIYRNVITLSF